MPRYDAVGGGTGTHGAGPGVVERSAAIEALVERMSSDPRFVHRHRDLPTAAEVAPADRIAALEGPKLGTSPGTACAPACHSLWTHQVAALEHVAAGRSVVIATPTASGKSLCYQIPALAAARRGATTVVVYPTKALAHDQLASLSAMAPPGVVVATYDGDCSATERAAVRRHAHVVLTNPEMLHLGILANHRRWDRFLERLELVVVDELHTLRGVFGSHVAHVLRRLRRLAYERRDEEPSFVFSSATIGRPEVLASQLSGTDIECVTESGAPTGERTTVLWNPFGDPDRAERERVSLTHETAAVAADMVAAGLRTLVFCRSRRGSELVAEKVRELLGDRGLGSAGRRVRTYRAGYLPEERRAIEVALGEGSLDCVVATNALELGIDVAGLDAVVLSGFPGTISAFRQQCGRAGRNARACLAVLVAGQDQLDQWVMGHPREALLREPEPAVINPANHHVLVPHIGCAADELALTHSDERYWGELLEDAVHQLVLDDRIRLTSSETGSDPRAVWSGRGAPAPAVGLRSASREEYRIRCADGTALGRVDAARVTQTVHEGATYLHQGTSWRVVELDHRHRMATVVPDDASTYTQVRSNTTVTLLDTTDSTSVGSVEVSWGRVVVTTLVTAYEERDSSDHSFIRRVPLETEPSVLDTSALWWTFGGEPVAAAGVAGHELAGALHAIEHTGIGILPLIALCDRWDLGGISTPWLADTGCATVMIHDAHPGGAGVAPMAFERAGYHLRATLEVLEGCGCATGCPSCVQSPKCGSGNEPLDKAAATSLLRSSLWSPAPDDATPGDARHGAAHPGVLNPPPVPSGSR